MAMDEGGHFNLNENHRLPLKRFRIGFIAEILTVVIALITFILTEDMRLPMILIDRWTPLMVLFLLACWIVDVRLMRYREKDPAEEDKS
ncbi:MAG: hypothetical protein IJK56_06675 [Firmicutes bacterium]|nr:hypothetical protein [Bacillota bacterium]